MVKLNEGIFHLFILDVGLHSKTYQSLGMDVDAFGKGLRGRSAELFQKASLQE